MVPMGHWNYSACKGLWGYGKRPWPPGSGMTHLNAMHQAAPTIPLDDNLNSSSSVPSICCHFCLSVCPTCRAHKYGWELAANRNCNHLNPCWIAPSVFSVNIHFITLMVVISGAHYGKSSVPDAKAMVIVKSRGHGCLIHRVGSWGQGSDTGFKAIQKNCLSCLPSSTEQHDKEQLKLKLLV